MEASLRALIGRLPDVPLFGARSRGAGADERPRAFWTDPSAYAAHVREHFLRPLLEAVRSRGGAPLAQQVEVLNRLHWYFTVDGRPVAPTLIVDEALAETFHALVSDVLRLIDPQAIEHMDERASVEVRHALLSYKSLTTHSQVVIDAFDRERSLVRLKYWVHGAPPEEKFVVDGVDISPSHAKYRACRYFRRTLFRERIVWLRGPPGSSSLEVWLRGERQEVGLGPQPFRLAPRAQSTAPPGALLARARTECPVGKGVWPASREGRAGRDLWTRTKASLLMALARSPIAARFRDAWVFADREHDADDNAEHLYRWVREHRPDVNAWFLLKPGTSHWRRLEREGFRLMPPGLGRQLLLLNSRHVLSSHPDLSFGRFDRSLYGSALQFRFTYLKHGVDYNDLSHYYVGREFDTVITASPAEHASFAADDTPYETTTLELHLCGLTRHDRLLAMANRLSEAERNEIIVMPTWRGRLIDDDLSPSERRRQMENSDFCREWSALLRDPRFLELAHAHGKKLVFVPHSNLVPYLDAFRVPPGVRVALPGDTSIQERFARCYAFITDYTSAAFDVALLRRAIFYFQFDGDQFYQGIHNWRPGYFHYAEDGFGPVVTTRDTLVETLVDFMARNGGVSPVYRERMERALPSSPVARCERVYGALTRSPQPG